MDTRSKFLGIIPVLPSSNIERDTKWYEDKTGFKVLHADNMYAVLEREGVCLHLQWHAGTVDDPLDGGSVIRLTVDNLPPVFEEFVQRGTVDRSRYVANTPWRTNEFGFFDLNRNAIFIMEDVQRREQNGSHGGAGR